MPSIPYKSPLLLMAALLVFALCTTGCRKDMHFQDLQHSLRFSADTLFLDTIAARTNSETFVLKAFNDRDEDVNIPSIRLGQGAESKYRLNVDGRAGFEFYDTPLRARDSLTIFLSVVATENPQEPLYEDFIEFSGAAQQKVMLYTMLQPAEYFVAPNDADFLELTGNTVWDAGTVKVIFGKLRVPQGQQLQIDAGTRVYMHRHASIEVAEDATLQINGTLQNPVNIRGLRHATRYDSLPKQWRHIELLPNASAHIQYADIKGGETALIMRPGSSAEIHNVRIFNFAHSGIHAFNAAIQASNVMISHAGDACLNIEGGGTYDFNHSTFANVWPVSLVGINGPAIPAYLADYYTENGNTVENVFTNTRFTNSIFYGRYSNGVYLDLHQPAGSAIHFDNCLIKNTDTQLLDIAQSALFQNCITGNPFFEAATLAENNLRLLEDSPARNAGSQLFAQNAAYDFFGTPRTATPDMGAIENQ
ncbi:MAG: right-handed parallel beta-helix repeat-containing protein [Weeksellaceae bacterium]|nr:right-handed parallel beta-helix repeat-containing protein [Weeksellaceae bacterium]